MRHRIKLAIVSGVVVTGLLALSAAARDHDHLYVTAAVNQSAFNSNLSIRIKNDEWQVKRSDIEALYPDHRFASQSWVALNDLPNTSWEFFAATQRLSLEIAPTKTREEQRRARTAALVKAGLITGVDPEISRPVVDNAAVPHAESSATLTPALTTSETQAPAAAATSFYLDLKVNRSPRNTVIEIKTINGQWHARKTELDSLKFAWHLPDQEWIALDGLPDSQWVYREATQQLEILTKANYLPLQDLTSASKKNALARRDTGFFINYSALYSDSEHAGEQASVFVDANAFTPALQLTSTGMYRLQDDRYSSQDMRLDSSVDNRGYTRFDTFLNYEMESARAVLQLGDVFNGGRDFLPSYRVGGLRISRDFGLAPDKIFYPIPEILGEAQIPSSVDIWINNQQLSALGVDSGPFKLSVENALSGYNSATIVTRDLQGRPVTQTLNFYVASQLLKKGLVDYDLTSGYVRENYGINSDDYGDSLLSSVRLAYGLTNYLTPELTAQNIQNRSNFGGGFRVAMGAYGTLHSTLSQSFTKDMSDGARAISHGYDFSRYGLGIYLNHTERDAHYADLVYSYFSNNLRRQTTVGVSQSFRKLGQLSLSFARREYHASPILPRPIVTPYEMGYADYPNFFANTQLSRDTEVLQASWHKAIGRDGMVTARWQRIRPLGEDAVTLGVTHYFKRRLSASVQSRQAASDNSTQFNLVRHPDYPYGLGWALSASDSGAHPRYGDVRYRHPYGNGALRVSHSRFDKTYMADWEGSIAYLDRGIYFAAPIYDAFALIDTGFADIPVYSGFQKFGPANAAGRRLLPDVTSYMTHQARIDPKHLPENILVRDSVSTFRVKRNGGVLVDFGLQLATQVRTRALDSQGQPLPAGTTLTNDQAQSAWVGWKGDLFIESARSAERWHWPEGECYLTLPSLIEGQSNYLDPLVCNAQSTKQEPATHAQ